MPTAALALALLTALSAQGALEEPFLPLGQSLLAIADKAGSPPLASSERASGEERLLARLALLHDSIELGVIEMWLPRVGCNERLREVKLARPRSWPALAECAVAVQARWFELAGPIDDATRLEGRHALETLQRWAKKVPVSFKLPQPGPVLEAAQFLRQHLAGRDLRMKLVLAPSRAQFVALIGSSGVQIPNNRASLWTAATLRTANTYFTPTALAFALVGGPVNEGDPPLEDRELSAQNVREYAAHAYSHQLSNLLVQSAPLWFCEGLALADGVAAVGSDETLCAGYSGRKADALDDLQGAAGNFMMYARIERSPFRSGGCQDLFVDELRTARVAEGFRILDLDTSRGGVDLPGPFLGEIVRMPDVVAIGPRGLKEGYAEFFRAYCGAFVAFLASQASPDGTLLERTLRELRARGSVDPMADDAGLAVVLRDLTGRTLGASLDPETDLEGAFIVWLQTRR